MKRNIFINLIFLVIFFFFLILSLTCNFFFFLPIFCILPFSCRTRNRIKRNQDYQYDVQAQPIQVDKEDSDSITKLARNTEIRYCPICGGAIKEPVAKFCYYCGAEL
ncbi:MAG: hypothetical protein ACTSRI_07525 [Promethearchaeota archaeon]